MFDTPQESPVKSPPVRMSDSPTPCSGYDVYDERVVSQAGGPQVLVYLPSVTLTSFHCMSAGSP
jgi:hypothetical protein